jgi:AcrR family transcriptional regulator
MTPSTTEVPRTRDVLMDAAELLFAERGVQGTTTREIVEAADQRNTSAVSYHFGSRENLLLEILARRGAPVDRERGVLRSGLGPTPSTDDLMRCLVEPYVALLGSPGGRAYLRVVAQLRGRFAGWRVDSDASTTSMLAGILDELECRPAGVPEVREARMLGMITLLTGLTAERAQVIDRGGEPALGQADFTDTLVDMCTAVLEG